MIISEEALIEFFDAVCIFAERQRGLIHALQLRQDVDELSFRSNLPKELVLGNARWRVRPHGVGICFTNCANGEVIDAHEGFIDSPDAFDAWRLSSYFRSKKLLPDNRNDWKEVLLSLLEKGLIRPGQMRRHLFVVATPTNGMSGAVPPTILRE